MKINMRNRIEIVLVLCMATTIAASAQVLTTLATFDGTNGSDPVAPLVQGTDGNFYGTTVTGGNMSPLCLQPAGSCGTIFRINNPGTFTTVYTFASNAIDGAIPYDLIQGNDRAFYGTTSFGGSAGDGTIFRMTSSGVLTTLYGCSQTNCTDGTNPSLLVQSTEGSFVGITPFGGRNNDGTIFRLLGGSKLENRSFVGSNGIYPETIIEASDGNFYGTASSGGRGNCSPFVGCGLIFEVPNPDGKISVLQNFSASDFGGGGLMQATSGVFYGTTVGGGTGYPQFGDGTVFSFFTGLGPFVSFVLPWGPEGRAAQILGQGFRGTTNVSFNGSPASFTVQSDRFLKATVPPGATTGYVTVTTSGVTQTSNVPFQVLP